MSYLIRSERCISQGALTNSKHPDSLVRGAYPTHISHGHGCYLYEAEYHKKYIDYICGLGTNLLGYGNDLINKDLQSILYGGFSHSLPTKQEVITAEKLKEIFVFVDHWKFLKSGSEACNAAIKIARAQTGRHKILSEGYHGWGDDFVSLTPPAKGVPPRGWIRKLTNFQHINKDVAAVIVEPVMTDYSPERIEWLKELRRVCDEHGTMLIFDEVITGFRFKKFSVSNAYNITPDLIVIGKAMANGLPLAAVGGKEHVMNNRDWFVSSTYAGEVLSLKACEVVCNLLQKNPDYNINMLWERGQDFIDAFNDQPTDIKISGYPTRGVFTGDEVRVATFMAEMAKLGILFCKSWFYNFHHWDVQEDVLHTSQLIKEKIERGMELKYPMPKSPFAAEVRKQ